ncbi:MAG: sulfatase [Draconibacterium sp.]|nr:sulfatase [Draconibacterium sp.]
MKKRDLLILLFLILFSCGENKTSQKPDRQSLSKPNVLFIAVDDLRPELGCYGVEQIHSPNIDKLASEGVMFQRAYCNIPVCGASRASILTGQYPTRTRFTTYYTRVEEDAPGIATLPEHFKNNGYFTTSYGKVFHHLDDGLSAWTESPWRPDYPNDIHVQEYWRDYRSPENIWTKDTLQPAGIAGPAWEKADVPDNAYYDGKVTDKTISTLKKLAQTKEPFFLGVGFVKPHLPFNAPSKYWDLYSEEEIEKAPNPFMPENAPKEANYNYGELRAYSNIPQGNEPLGEELARPLKHGYYACVSYIDALIGNILNTLEETGLAENTIVVLWGDHGFSLGEHTHWCKHTCFHIPLHTPLIVKAPGFSGSKTEALVSYIDVYPTLCELAGLELPEHLHGESMITLMNNPETKGGEEFCRYPNKETIVNEKYTYTEFYNRKTNEYLSNMLYDLEKDPQENINVASAPEYSNVVAELRTKLRKHISEINRE